MRYTHQYQCVYLVKIPEPVQYHIYAMAFPFDVRCESVTYKYTPRIALNYGRSHINAWSSLVAGGIALHQK